MLQDSRNLKIIELQKGQDSLLWVSYSDKEAESGKLCLSRCCSSKSSVYKSGYAAVALALSFCGR